MSKTMKVARFTAPGSKLEIASVPVPTPKHGEVLIKVKACGFCHSDLGVQSGSFGNTFPRVPGHELAGTIESSGEGAKLFKHGEHVGVGWFGGHCGVCVNCKKDAWVACKNAKFCGVHYDGGFAEYVVVPEDAVARIPEGLSSEQAGPLLCAGITTFNAMRNSGARAGDICVVQGIGGLGHLAVQFGKKMGFKVVAVSNGKDKESLAKKLGAHVYIDASAKNAVQEIQKLGGAKIIVATAPKASIVEEIIPALGLDGKLILLAALGGEKLSVDPIFLLMNRCCVQGWPSGDSRDSEDTMNFAVLNDVLPMIETFPLEKAQDALESVVANKARFRAVLTMH